MMKFFCGILLAFLLIQGVFAAVSTSGGLSIAQYPDAKRAMLSLTFDDGTKDHYSLAAPLLEKYGYRGIFSIIPDYLGSGKYMSWNNVKELKVRGHEIANHSMSHQKLVPLYQAGDTNELKRQIFDSLDVFEKNVGFRPTVFCYPCTSLNEELNAIVQKSGQEPMMRLRYVFLRDTRLKDFGEYLDNVVSNREFKAVVFHGIDPKGRGWEAFADPAGFEKVLRYLKSRESEIHIGRYSDNMSYFNRQQVAELVAEKTDTGWSSYRLVSTNGVQQGSLFITVASETKAKKISLSGKPVTLATNALGVVYFPASFGDVISVAD